MVPTKAAIARRNGSDGTLALSLQSSGRTDPCNVPHQHSQMVSAGVDQQSVPDVGLAPASAPATLRWARVDVVAPTRLMPNKRNEEIAPYRAPLP